MLVSCKEESLETFKPERNEILIGEEVSILSFGDNEVNSIESADSLIIYVTTQNTLLGISQGTTSITINNDITFPVVVIKELSTSAKHLIEGMVFGDGEYQPISDDQYCTAHSKVWLTYLKDSQINLIISCHISTIPNLK